MPEWSETAEQRFVEFTCRNFGPCGYYVENRKMAGDVNHAIGAFLPSLLAFITTF